MRGRWRLSLISCCAVVAVVGTAVPSMAQSQDEPPGAPGVRAPYAPADKQGFGTAKSAASPVWFTLGHGGTTELFYPNLSTPASRTLQLVVSDGETFAQRLSDVPTRTEPIDAKTPSYRQISTGDGWTATTTYVTDPARASVLVDFSLRSLSGEPLQAYAIHEPTLSKDGSDDEGGSEDGMLFAQDKNAASALRAEPGFTAMSTGYLGTSDGWTDLSRNKTLTQRYDEAQGNIGQVGRLPIDGVDSSHALLTLGFGENVDEAVSAATASEQTGFEAVSAAYRAGWQQYLASLKPAPSSLASEHEEDVYWSSITELASSEDKQRPGAFIASPSEPWVWRDRNGGLAPDPGPYHLVWPRDLYQHATGLLAAGDAGAAHRAWEYLMSIQAPDGHLPQNTQTTGEAYWTSVQLDETALPIVLAWQLGRTDPASLDAVRKAAEFLIDFSYDGYPSPYSEQERWENQSGYSPGTIASTIAALVCAADLLERSGDSATAEKYLAVADDWESKVEEWTATSNGPFSDKPYYLRVTKDGNPNQGTMYNPGDNHPEDVDQRTQVDPSFLELVRLGVRSHDDPVVRNSIKVVDDVLSEQTPAGQFWHRFTDDGYGEKADGGQWDLTGERTYGRLWPIFAGERGEYELLAGQTASARERLTAMAATANQGLMLPEQVWDNRAPAGGADGPQPGTPTFSATPLSWTHGQYVRLAWSIDAGYPVERPSVVADRYAER